MIIEQYSKSELKKDINIAHRSLKVKHRDQPPSPSSSYAPGSVDTLCMLVGIVGSSSRPCLGLLMGRVPRVVMVLGVAPRRGEIFKHRCCVTREHLSQWAWHRVGPEKIVREAFVRVGPLARIELQQVIEKIKSMRIFDVEPKTLLHLPGKISGQRYCAVQLQFFHVWPNLDHHTTDPNVHFNLPPRSALEVTLTNINHQYGFGIYIYQSIPTTIFSLSQCYRSDKWPQS